VFIWKVIYYTLGVYLNSQVFFKVSLNGGNELEKIITGVTIYSGENLERKPDHAVWIKDGKLYRILKSSEVPTGIDVINKSGLYLFPGLIDLHVHIMWDGSRDPVETHEKEGYEQMLIRAVANCQEYVRSGVTTIRDLGSIKDIALHVAESIDKGILKGPRVIACGQTLTMTGGHDPFWGNFCDGPYEVLKAVREQIYKNAQVIKVSATGGVYGRTQGEKVDNSELTYEELKVICDEAHRFGLKVASHAIGRDGIINSVKAGVNTIEHGHFIDEEIVEMMLERNTAWIPTLYIYQQIANLEEVPKYSREKARQIVKRHEEAFSTYFNSGVLIGSGSDAGSVLTPHPSVIEELLTMKKHTSDVTKILKTATSNAGKILGLNVGEITEGYEADFILLENDPLSDITALKNIQEVYINGKQVSTKSQLVEKFFI
jgi:imidazolonepropionase-like amidohydrolase